jgi:flagellar hook protein FlgE
MSFQTGLSGLNTSSKDLDIIGNNVANASVTGFKNSRGEFSDLFAASLSGASAQQVGIGSQVAAVAQLFTQGDISVTNNPLDVAINGNGFFRLDRNGAITYTRDGQFNLDSQGFIVNSHGLDVTGYGVDANGNILTATPGPIQISAANIAPRMTAAFAVGLNLDSRSTPPATAIFNALDPTSFNFSTSGNVFDSLGNPHTLTTYYVNTGPGVWSVHGAIDGSVPNTNLGAGAGLPVALNFNTAGTLTGVPAMPLNASVVVGGAATTPLLFKLDFTGTTQYGAAFGVNNLTQDGYTSGHLTGFNISDTGVVLGSYSNGLNRNLGQLVLASFRDTQGLNPIGNNQWAETSASGLPIVGVAGTGSLGVMQSAAIEQSNVDLTTELVKMITAQRVYQANAQTIKTQDTILQSLINLP